MKAPNKIFLSVEKGEDWTHAMWTQKDPKEQKFSELDEHEDYIRKGALLEWAKEMLKSCDGSVAMKRAYEKLTEHIELL